MTSRERSPRHHRRKRLLIYRPSPDDFLKTPPQPLAGVRHDMTPPRGFLSTLHRASPMERERRKILSVELRDIGHEVELLQGQMSEFEGRRSSTDGGEEGRDRGQTTSPTDPPPAILPISTEDPALTLCRPPLMSPPKEESGWGLLPLFNSVRSKLESFAEIFLTPVKSKRGPRNSEAGAGTPNQPECCVPGDPVQPYTPPPDRHRLSDVSSVRAAEDNPSQRTPPTLQTETSSILCRPPLRRRLSGPLLPVTQHKRQHSVDTAEPPAEPCACWRRRYSVDTAEPPAEPCACRRRRHSVDTAEPPAEPCACRRRQHSVESAEPPAEPCACRRRRHSVDTAEPPAEPCACRRRQHSVDTAEPPAEPCACRRRQYSVDTAEPPAEPWACRRRGHSVDTAEPPAEPCACRRRRHSVDTAEPPAEPCACRRRRHSVDTAELPAEPCACRRRRHSVDTAEPPAEPCACRRRQHSVDTAEPPAEPCACRRRQHSVDTAEPPAEPCACWRRRHSVDTAEPPAEPCACRRRRHSLDTAEPPAEPCACWRRRYSVDTAEPPAEPCACRRRRHSVDTAEPPAEPRACRRRRHSVDTAEPPAEPRACWRRQHCMDTAEPPAEPCACRRRRHSVDTAEPPAEPPACRRRRHSLGSVEECRSLMPFFMSCLRKENHPSVLKLSPLQPGDVRKSPHGEGFPPGLCLDPDRDQGQSGADHQVTREPLPDSDFKTPENRSKENKVSNIQIRKRALRQEGKLTPLGLPKRVRLQKEDFSLEEIYTNKNYRTPTEKRKFETIFEEPIMKGGTLILTSQRPLRRIMVFKDGGAAPRKRKKKGKAAGRTRRWTDAGAEENVNYELLLQNKLQQLEAALQEDPPGM